MYSPWVALERALLRRTGFLRVTQVKPARVWVALPPPQDEETGLDGV